jgi:hypothetical protein
MAFKHCYVCNQVTLSEPAARCSWLNGVFATATPIRLGQRWLSVICARSAGIVRAVPGREDATKGDEAAGLERPYDASLLLLAVDSGQHPRFLQELNLAAHFIELRERDDRRASGLPSNVKINTKCEDQH